MSSIGALCDRLGKTFLTFLLGNLGATGGLRVNSSPVKVKLIIFPLFLPERNAILPMTAKEACGGKGMGSGEVCSLNCILSKRPPSPYCLTVMLRLKRRFGDCLTVMYQKKVW